MGTAWVWEVMSHTPQCLPGGAHFWPGPDSNLRENPRFHRFTQSFKSLFGGSQGVRFSPEALRFLIVWQASATSDTLRLTLRRTFLCHVGGLLADRWQALSYLWILVHCGLGVVAWCPMDRSWEHHGRCCAFNETMIFSRTRR